MFSLNEVTRRIEEQIRVSLAFCNLCDKSQRGYYDDEAKLANLYAHIRIKVGIDVTAGLFNKVIDDMSRIGLLRVDRKTKTIVDIRFDHMPQPLELKNLGESPHYGWLWLADLYRADMTAAQAKQIVERAVQEGSATPKVGV